MINNKLKKVSCFTDKEVRAKLRLGLRPVDMITSAKAIVGLNDYRTIMALVSQINRLTKRMGL